MRFLDTTFFKATAIVILASSLLAGTITLLNDRSALELTLNQLEDQATGTTAIVAGQLTGAIRFGGGPQIEKILRQIIDDPANPSNGAVALDKHGAKITGYLTEGDEATLTELGKAALEAGQDRLSDDGLHVATLVRNPENDKVLGVLVTGWSDKAARATLTRMQSQTLLIAAGVLLAVAVATSLLFRWMMSQPLHRVEATMGRVAAGELDLTVPETDRRDEIGRIAKSLEAFRGSLQQSEQTNRIATMRGAALSAGSTAMMLTDLEHRITDVNAAMIALMRHHAPALRRRHPDFDPEALIGRRADQILESGTTAKAELRADETRKVRIEQDLETGALVVEVNPVHDASGAKIGFVAEWRDETAGRHNAAILEALDTTQVRAEFGADGRLGSANPRFCSLLGAEISDLRGTGFKGQLRLREAEGLPVFERVNAGETLVGRFEFETGPGRVAILDGTFGAVRNRSGEVQMLLLMATDVTEQVNALAATETARAREQQAQREVVEALRAALAALSEGELATRIDRPFPDEYETLRQDFNRAKANLCDAMRSVLANSSSIRDEAKQITSAADDMSRRTEQQAATLEETASALNELTAAVHSAAENADRANAMVSDAKSKAETSGNVVKDAVLAMGEIEESSNKISKITSVIDEIAFQTNLLALNAGVEAARAGEAGRGFAVVASEVRALAQRSSDAAREIAQLISSSTNQVKRGVGLVGQAGEALAGIQSSVADISVCVSDIAVSTREQSSGLSEINTAVNQLDQVTQRNVAMFEETTAASQSLLREANGLSEAMGRFQIGTDPTATRIARTPTAAPAAAASAGPAQVPKSQPRMPKAPPPLIATARAGGGTAAPKPSFVSARATGSALAAPAYDEQDDWEEF